MDRRTEEISCRKHPSVSAIGICPYCLNDRLLNLVCSECGEQRLSSCSCSDISPKRTSNATLDPVNIVKMASLIDEETTKQRNNRAVETFQRSNSSCVDITRNNNKKNHRFSRISRFLRKINPKNKESDFDKKNVGVSRSRSLCSFRGVQGSGYFINSEEDSGARSSFSAARSSSVTTVEQQARKSNFEGGRKSNFSESNFSESEPPRRSGFEARKSNFSENEYIPRKSNFSENFHQLPPRRSNYEVAARKSDSAAGMSYMRRVMSMKESYFSGGEENDFIDLKFDTSCGGDVVVNDGVLEHGGGRLSTGRDREVSKSSSRRSFKGWKWIFGQHQHLHT